MDYTGTKSDLQVNTNPNLAATLSHIRLTQHTDSNWSTDIPANHKPSCAPKSVSMYFNAVFSEIVKNGSKQHFQTPNFMVKLSTHWIYLQSL